MTRYIDPLSDFGFKKLFGSEQSKDLLISFLNDLLNVDIESLEFGNLEIHGITENSRKAIFDIYCIDKSKRRFIVEMQKAIQPNFKDRILYYSSVVIVDQAKKSNWKWLLDPVYIVAILGTFTISENNEYLHRIHLKNECNQIFNPNLNQVFIELPNFNKTLNELETHLDKWLYFLKNLEDLDDIPSTFLEDIYLKEAFEIANLSKYKAKELAEYEIQINEQRIRESELEGAEQKGIKRGEFQAKLETARKMLNKQMPLDIIIELTGLTEYQLKQMF